MALNTLQIANRLKAAEREGRSAEEIALVFGEIEDERYTRLVTREHLEVELEKVRAELRTEIEKVRAELQMGLEKLRHDLTLRLGGMIVAAVAVLGGLNVFF